MPAQPAVPITEIVVQPVTPERWDDLAALFGKNGAYANCWCMWWRLSRAEFSRLTGEERRAALKAQVDANRPPGLLAYVKGKPAAWCSIAPRPEFASLERSRVLARVDEEPVWSIVCFFVGKGYRKRGILLPLIQAAVQYAAAQGARIVEAYPVETSASLAPVSSFMGTASVFHKAGFVEVARRSARRPVMRYTISQ